MQVNAEIEVYDKLVNRLCCFEYVTMILHVAISDTAFEGLKLFLEFSTSLSPLPSTRSSTQKQNALV